LAGDAWWPRTWWRAAAGAGWRVVTPQGVIARTQIHVYV